MILMNEAFVRMDCHDTYLIYPRESASFLKPMPECFRKQLAML